MVAGPRWRGSFAGKWQAEVDPQRATRACFGGRGRRYALLVGAGAGAGVGAGARVGAGAGVRCGARKRGAIAGTAPLPGHSLALQSGKRYKTGSATKREALQSGKRCKAGSVAKREALQNGQWRRRWQTRVCEPQRTAIQAECCFRDQAL
eukprot:366149-Chlamydomonas_euryale.AAC.4